MSLILGVNLPSYIYLVCDTRLTHKLNGNDFYQDNLSKFHCFNDDISVVVAGNVVLANYVLRKLNDEDIIKKGYKYFEKNIKEIINKILDNYMQEDGKYHSAFMIFAGFDESHKKQINASYYGNALASNFPSDKNGTIKKVTINKGIIQKIVEAAVKGGGDGRQGVIGTLEKDAVIETDDPYSSIITVEIDLPNEIKINKIDCYKYVMRGPNGLDEDNLPQDVCVKLEESQSKNLEDTIGTQSVVLMSWVNSIIEGHQLDTVGGDILVNMITPKGAIIMTGVVGYLDKKTEETKKISETIVHKEKFCVKSQTGEIIPLINIIDFNKKGEFEI